METSQYKTQKTFYSPGKIPFIPRCLNEPI